MLGLPLGERDVIAGHRPAVALPEVVAGPVDEGFRVGELPLQGLLVGLVRYEDCAGETSVSLAARLQGRQQAPAVGQIREDELAAASMGIDLTRTKLWAFALGASFSGFAGSLFSSAFQYVHPSQFEFTLSVLILCAVILGGIGNVYGAVLGAVLIGSFDRVLAERLTVPLNAFGNLIGSDWLAHHNVGDDRYLVFGLALVLMMLLRPGGLFPNKQRAAEMEATSLDVSVQQQEDLFDTRVHDDLTPSEQGGQVA